MKTTHALYIFVMLCNTTSVVHAIQRKQLQRAAVMNGAIDIAAPQNNETIASKEEKDSVIPPLFGGPPGGADGGSSGAGGGSSGAGGGSSGAGGGSSGGSSGHPGGPPGGAGGAGGAGASNSMQSIETAPPTTPVWAAAPAQRRDQAATKLQAVERGRQARTQLLEIMRAGGGGGGVPTHGGGRGDAAVSAVTKDKPETVGGQSSNGNDHDGGGGDAAVSVVAKDVEAAAAGGGGLEKEKAAEEGRTDAQRRDQAAIKLQDSRLPPLPPSWTRVKDDRGADGYYYWNEVTNETTWEIPVDYDTSVLALIEEMKVDANAYSNSTPKLQGDPRIVLQYLKTGLKQVHDRGFGDPYKVTWVDFEKHPHLKTEEIGLAYIKVCKDTKDPWKAIEVRDLCILRMFKEYSKTLINMPSVLYAGFRAAPSIFRELPPDAQQKIIENQSLVIDAIRSNPKFLEELPPTIQNESQIYEIAFLALIEKMKVDNYAYESHSTPKLRGDPRIVLEYLKDPYKVNWVDFKEHPNLETEEIGLAYIKACKDYMQNPSHFILRMFKEDSKNLINMPSVLYAGFRTVPSIFGQLPPDAQQKIIENHSLVVDAIRSYPELLKDLPPTIQNESWVLNALENLQVSQPLTQIGNTKRTEFFTYHFPGTQKAFARKLATREPAKLDVILASKDMYLNFGRETKGIDYPSVEEQVQLISNLPAEEVKAKVNMLRKFEHKIGHFENDPMTKTPVKFKLASFNAFSGKGSRSKLNTKLNDYMSVHTPDVVVMQEALCDLEIDGYTQTFCQGRNDPEMMAAYVRYDSDWKLESETLVELSETKCYTKTRTANTITLTHKHTDQIFNPITIANVHLCGGGYDEREMGENDLQDLKKAKTEMLEAVMTPAKPDFIVGDFNSDFGVDAEGNARNAAQLEKEGFTTEEKRNVWNNTPLEYLVSKNYKPTPFLPQSSRFGPTTDAMFYASNIQHDSSIGFDMDITAEPIEDVASDHNGVMGEFTIHPRRFLICKDVTAGDIKNGYASEQNILEFQKVQKIFEQTATLEFNRGERLDASTIESIKRNTITSVKYCTNEELERKYEAKKIEFKEMGKPVDEEWVWHGSPAKKNLMGILEHGFQWKFVTRAFYGPGYYGTVSAVEACEYSNHQNPILLGTVIKGTTATSDAEYRASFDGYKNEEILSDNFPEPITEIGKPDYNEKTINPNFRVIRTAEQFLPRYIVGFSGYTGEDGGSVCDQKFIY